MTETIGKRKETSEKKKDPDNIFLDVLYNIFAWLPVTIITWIISQFEP
jgi:hypothetical protein